MKLPDSFVKESLPSVLDKKKAAHELSVSVRQIEYLIEKGELNAFKIGRSVRIATSEIGRFIKARLRDSHITPIAKIA